MWVPILFWYAINPYLSPDSYWYLTAAQAIRTNTWRENYVWNRTPGYPAFLAIAGPFAEVNYLYVITTFQILITIFSLRALSGILKEIKPNEAKNFKIERFFGAATILCFVFFGGYVSAILQQSLIFNSLIWINIFLVKGFRKEFSTRKELIILSFLIVIEFMIHPFCAVVLCIGYPFALLARMKSNQSKLRMRKKMKISIFRVALSTTVLTITAVSWMFLSTNAARDQVDVRSVDGVGNRAASYLVTDPNFIISVGLPLVRNPIERALSTPKYMFENLIDFPLQGPNIHIGFFRMFDTDKRCVVQPSEVILHVSPGLLKEVPTNCWRSINIQFEPAVGFAAPLVYYLAYFLVFVLLAISILGIYRSDYLLLIMYIPPLAFVLLYSILGAHENRYGAPATAILCLLGSYRLARYRNESIEKHESFYE